MIRISFLLLVFFVFCLASGWIEIQCKPDKIQEDIQKRIAELKIMISSQKSTEYNSGQAQFFQNLNNKSYYLIIHEVQPGENLADLERIYGTSWKVIQRANDIPNPNRLLPGRLIIVPVIKEFG